MDYSDQREFDAMMNDIKKGDRFTVRLNHSRLKGGIYEAVTDNPYKLYRVTDNKTPSTSNGTPYIQIRNDHGYTLTTGDIERHSRILQSNEKVVSKFDKGMVDYLAEPIGEFTGVTEITDDNGNVIGLSTGIEVRRDLLFPDGLFETINANTIDADMLMAHDEINKAETGATNGKVKSDGGKSSYYKAPLPEHVIRKIMLQLEGNEPMTLEVEDIADIMFGNDFDFASAFKSMRRLYMDKIGQGKEGNDAAYELKKIRYSTDKIEEKL